MIRLFLKQILRAIIALCITGIIFLSIINHFLMIFEYCDGSFSEIFVYTIATMGILMGSGFFLSYIWGGWPKRGD